MSKMIVQGHRRKKELSNHWDGQACLNSRPVCESVYINADLTKAEAHAAYRQRCRRRGMTADRRINPNTNHPNNDTDDAIRVNSDRRSRDAGR